jgi:hypothetical protein
VDSGGPTQQAPPPETPGLELPPWENRERYGFFNGLYLTVRDVLSAPGAFFARMPTRLGLWQPLLFAVVIGVISAFFDWMWSLAASSLRVILDEDVGRLLRGPFYSGLFWILSPLIAVVGLFVRAGVVHLCALLLGGGRFGFEATLRVVAYSDAVWIFALLPFCGNVVALFWGTATAIIGLQKSQQMEGWRATLAVLLPLLLCLVSCFGFSLIGLATFKGLDAL